MERPKNPACYDLLSRSNERLIFHIVLIFILLGSYSLVKAQNKLDNQKITGFYEGEFMPGNNFTLILVFEKDDNFGTKGRILLYQGATQIQDDPLKNIELKNGQLSFLIEAKDTPFSGNVTNDFQEISGEFLFPDGSAHPIVVNKVEVTTYGNLGTKKEEIQLVDPLLKRFTSSALREDFQFMRNNLERIHPALYAFTPEIKFDRIFDSVYESLNTQMTEDEFFRTIAPVVADVYCGHTGIRFSSQYSIEVGKTKHLLPLDIHFIKDKAFVIHNYSKNTTPEPGMQIISINGLSMNDIRKQLMTCIPSDGFNITAKMYEINTNFAYVYSQYMSNYNEFDLECSAEAGKRIRLKLTAIDEITLDEAISKTYPNKAIVGQLPVDFEISPEENTAVLTIKGFWARDWDQYSDFLQDAFGQIKTENIQNLIVDVRGNGGGHPFFAAELLSYIADTSFIYFELPEDQGDLAPLYKSVPVKEERFAGNIYLLIDGGCLSTTGHFISLVDFHQLATLIGEQSGSSFSCNDGSVQLELLNTKIRFNLPQLTFQTAVTGYVEGDPLLPDYMVRPALNDLLNAHDETLAFTFNLIKSKSPKEKKSIK